MNNKVMGGRVFASRSSCDIDLQGSDPNVARDMSGDMTIISVKNVKM
jgi:hypothetical protein